MRCLRLIADLVRAYRATTEATIALPTYERLPAFVICYSAPARRSQVKVENRPADHIRTTGRWTGPTLVMLEHGNLPDPVMGEEISGTVDSAFGQYMWRLRSGDRGLIYRERYTEAVRALQVDGSYGQAVVLAVIASEVLIDWLLALLLWEKGADTNAAAAFFREGGMLRRLTHDLPPLLKGNWSTATPGPVATWYRDAYVLRHGGLTASRPAARAALDATHALERHAMDQLTAQRSSFPRVTLMTVAERGLRRRGMWSGKIKAFSENEARREPNWAESFRGWHADLEQARVDSLTGR